MNALPAIQLCFDAGLVALVWLVQLVIYPSFSAIAPDRFKDWHTRYTRQVSLVVLPLMLGQVACLLLEFIGSGPWLRTFLVAVAWGVTFGVSVRLHSQLQDEQDPQVIEKLIRSNWIRTGAWSLVLPAHLIS